MSNGTLFPTIAFAFFFAVLAGIFTVLLVRIPIGDDRSVD
jgi:hypothetical protein